MATSIWHGRDCVACHSIPGGEGSPAASNGNAPRRYLLDQHHAGSGDRIGRYSLADFDLAVRHGIAKDGHRLYPAMPYPSYVKLADADVAALYRFS